MGQVADKLNRDGKRGHRRVMSPNGNLFPTARLLFGGTSFPSGDTSGQTRRLPGVVRRTSRITGGVPDVTRLAPRHIRRARGGAGCTPAHTGGVSGDNGGVPGVMDRTSGLVRRASGLARCVSGVTGGVFGVAGDVSGVDRCMIFSVLRWFCHCRPFPDGSPQQNT